MCGVYRSDGSAPPYEGDKGIGAVLAALAKGDWEPVVERGHIIALVRGDTQITIEPGGQLEHAARPVSSVVDLEGDITGYVAEVCAPSRAFDIAWLALGIRPFGSLEEIPWMPKHRYDIMRDYLPTRGSMAHDMMKRTATVQVNLDYQNADDARDKLRSIMSVTSILTAIYANSPIVGGKDSGFQSYRAEIWRDTDPDRCGLLPFVFEDGDVFSQYVEWALDVPMFFVHRGEYLPAGGTTFRQFVEEGWQGHSATMDDWALHLSTLFPEARMKKFIEVRGCDAGTVPMILALGPLCQGLFYSAEARQAATALTSSLDFGQRVELIGRVARKGLAAEVPGLRADGKSVQVGTLARELMAIARAGLEQVDANAIPYLEPLQAIVDEQRTLADHVRETWESVNGDLSAFIDEVAYPELSSC
jgi:glutamate--cysteine ligase